MANLPITPVATYAALGVKVPLYSLTLLLCEWVTEYAFFF